MAKETSKLFDELQNEPGGAWSATWLINAPWAHPVWSQYMVLLYDLTTVVEGGQPLILYKPDVTHELMMYAVDPKIRIDEEKPLTEQKFTLLQPANYGYQFVAENNEAAQQRVQKLVDRIDAYTLSPDTDYRSVWNELFNDGYALGPS